ncbi:uncharacterized protein LOC121045872 [Ixodes scapularis]|nr:uncharacterized protein LOC121045872 [Ixodes scapularis]
MVRKKQLDHTKKRSRWKTDAEECSNWDSGASQTLDALQATVFGATSDRCKTAHLKELYKRSQLLAAAFCGHGEAVDVLLKAGHDPNVTARDGSTPLMLAINQGHRDIASKLIEQGADSCLVNQDGTSAMHMMVRKMDAVMFNDLWSSLEKSGRINISAVDKNGKNMLHAAAELGWDFCVAFLLSRSSLNVEQTSKEGRTPLMCAAAEGQTAVVERLLQAGVRLLTEDQSASTAACLAISRRHGTAANLLLNKMGTLEKNHYVERRVSLLAPPSTPTRDQRSFFRDTLFRVFLSIRRQMEGGTELLLCHNVFEALIACGRRHACDPSITSPLFHLCACLLHDKADYSKYVHYDMAKAFIEAGGLDLTHEVSYKVGDPCDVLCRCSVLLPVLPAAELEDGLQWVRSHLEDLLPTFREFAYKKDIITYWADGEQVKTSVMWERFKENFSRIYLEAKGSPPDCVHEPAHGQDFDTNTAFSLHSVAQTTLSRGKGPALLPKKSGQKAQNKKIARPRAIQTMIQVTFTEESRFPKKARGTLTYPQKPIDVRAGSTEPANVFEAMSMAPKVTPTVLPLQGYANAVKSNIPNEVTSLHSPEVTGDCDQPKYKFTDLKTPYPWKETDISLLGCQKFAGCSSQPTLPHAFSGGFAIRHTKSDPELSSTGPNSSFPATIELFKELPPLKTNDVAASRSAVEQRAQECLSSYDQCKRKLPCQRLHALQEHLFGEIIRSLQMTKAEDRDAMTTVMTLMESMMNSINTLTPRHSKGKSDFRLHELLLRTDDEKDFAVVSDQQEGRKRPLIETNMDCYLAGEWFEGLASTAERTVVQEDPTSLSSVWVSENLRWESTFRELAHAPLCSLTLTNGVFYNEEKKHIPTMSRDDGTTSVYLGIAENGREVILKKIQLQSPISEVMLERLRSFKHCDLAHRNINGLQVLWENSGKVLNMIWQPQERNLEEHIAMLRELKCSLVQWARIAMPQLLDALSFLHSRTHPVLHGRLKPSNILVSSKGILFLSDLMPQGVLTNVPLGFIQTPVEGRGKNTVSDVSWRPRELIKAVASELAAKVMSTASDMQVAGMLIYYMVTGNHLFGKNDLECQTNILRGRPILNPVNAELDDLVHHLVTLEPEYRLSASEAIRHPVFWGPKKRMFFLSTVALEMERQHLKWPPDDVLRQFEVSCSAFVTWKNRLPPCVVTDKFATEDSSTAIVSLLRFIKCCALHYDSLSTEAQSYIRQPEKLFEDAFPGLLMAVHGVVRRTHWRYCRGIEAFF